MRTAKLFQSGRSQVIRLPEEFRFRGDRVFIKKLGNAIVVLPYQDSWQPLIESVALFTDDFME